MTVQSTKKICIHGHFYQPPREDPFTHRVPNEHGAAPYLNFNEKITAECYKPNAEAGNFEHISFDFGPTLADWLEHNAADVYHRIIASDKAALERDGVGSAIAHAYNHTILPLANSRDKRAQISWGIQDFQNRFGRWPEGMWLAETAIDIECLEILKDYNIAFTILAPWQSLGGVDSTEPYWVALPSGRRIAVFFYDGHLSGGASFVDSVTENADAFVADIITHHVNWEKAAAGEDQLISVATDGELYGHHKPFRDRFLTQLIQNSAPAFGYEVTTYAKYLRDHPPVKETRIYAPSAWSCAHGVDRWNVGCACTEGEPQKWKPGLRDSLNQLAEKIDTLFAEYTAATLKDPWLAREEYVSLRNEWITEQHFWEKHSIHGRKPFRETHAARIWHLLEAEYYMQASYTSCGWFFEDIDRIEPRNDINYARCAISHVWQALHINLQDAFVANLAATTHSWRSPLSGAAIYTQLPPPPAQGILPPLKKRGRKEPAA